MSEQLRQFLELLQQYGYIPDCDDLDQIPPEDLEAALRLLEKIKAL